MSQPTMDDVSEIKITLKRRCKVFDLAGIEFYKHGTWQYVAIDGWKVQVTRK